MDLVSLVFDHIKFGDKIKNLRDDFDIIKNNYIKLNENTRQKLINEIENLIDKFYNLDNFITENIKQILNKIAFFDF